MAGKRVSDRQRFWRETIERQQVSGQSILGFCAAEGLSPASFHAWKRQLRMLRRESRRKSVKQALVPVQIVEDQPAGGGNLEVQWPSGVVLRVAGNCDVQTVGVVVAAISAKAARGPRRC